MPNKVIIKKNTEGMMSQCCSNVQKTMFDVDEEKNRRNDVPMLFQCSEDNVLQCLYLNINLGRIAGRILILILKAGTLLMSEFEKSSDL